MSYYTGNYASTGPILRAHPKMRVLRGYDPTRPSTVQKSAPVAANTTIFSGQVISLSWNSGNQRFEWSLGGAGINATDPVYFANGETADPDVISADSLPALPCYGQFVIQTGYFSGANGDHATDATAGANVSDWIHGYPITYSTVYPGYIVPTTYGSGAPIIGMVDGINGPGAESAIFSLGQSASGPVISPAAVPGVYYPPYAPADSSASNLYVVQLVTRFDPQNAVIG